MMKKLSTPLKRAKGLGASGTGTDEWLTEQLIAVTLIPLTLFLLISFTLQVSDYTSALAWVQTPHNAILIVITLCLGTHYCSHMIINEIFLDYVHHEGLKIAGILVTKLLGVFFVLFGTLALLKILFGV